MSRSWAKGSTRQWRATRASVLRRDGYRCQLAYPGTWLTRDGQLRRCLVVATHVHHKLGKAYGDNPTDLQASCSACNLRTGDPTRSTDPPPKPRTRW